MPLICYTSKIRFISDHLRVIKQTNEIIASYKAQGFDLTLRQLYYKLVALDLFPEDRRFTWIEATRKWVRDPNGTKNAQPNYKWLGEIINDARLAGLIDWLDIIDRTRNLRGVGHWSDPSEIIGNYILYFPAEICYI